LKMETPKKQRLCTCECTCGARPVAQPPAPAPSTPVDPFEEALDSVMAAIDSPATPISPASLGSPLPDKDRTEFKKLLTTLHMEMFRRLRDLRNHPTTQTFTAETYGAWRVSVVCNGRQTGFMIGKNKATWCVKDTHNARNREIKQHLVGDTMRLKDLFDRVEADRAAMQWNAADEDWGNFCVRVRLPMEHAAFPSWYSCASTKKQGVLTRITSIND